MSSLPPEVDATVPIDEASKKAYRTPVLRALGSVAELTAGGGTRPVPDGKSGMSRP